MRRIKRDGWELVETIDIVPMVTLNLWSLPLGGPGRVRSPDEPKTVRREFAIEVTQNEGAEDESGYDGCVSVDDAYELLKHLASFLMTVKVKDDELIDSLTGEIRERFSSAGQPTVSGEGGGKSDAATSQPDA